MTGDPSVLCEWLGEPSLDRFTTDELQRTPIARPGTAVESARLLDWATLGRVLAADPRPDVLVVARGKLLAVRAPRTLDELGRYLRAGIGLSLRHTERCEPGLARLAASFATLGPSHVQLFVTPGETYGFGWHYDDEDVFIVQTAGVKEYFFRPNTVAQETPSATAFAAFARETSPVSNALLVAGDFLYLPRRWWHMALCRETALSISVGVLVRRGGATPIG